ncbi:MAG TPA: hypothetical protein VF167_15325 [Longimicrobiaceae bacterium]
MRTRQQHQFDYAGLTTGEFARRTGQSPEQVRDLIESGWFRWNDGVPEVLDVSSPGAKRPSYRISRAALQRYYEERSHARKRSA